jgi:hypothetical protein
MEKKEQIQYAPVDATPVKSFFVTMLTRDIKLEEAILDLLDNCVDGILRSKNRNGETKPYKGFKAEIEFKKSSFMISDNCGGIPWSLHSYAFRMGRASDRPADTPGTVGVYGIGMKRAIFKMGKDCLISTQNGKHGYDVQIKPEWIDDEKMWEIPVKAAKTRMIEDGTTILIGNLYSGIAARFSEDAKDFESDLRRMVSTHYAFIIDKGFEVIINGKAVTPQPTKLIFDKRDRRSKTIQPFIFKTRTEDGVDVFLAVGFTRPIPTEEEVATEQEEIRYSSVDAGWTVICNDRAVLYCDRSELTGWGEAGVPRYHTQFIAISGVVEFWCNDASKLPTTTTKRGIDAASHLYLQIRNKMREGMLIFIDYTNKWKGRVEEAKKHIEGKRAIPFDEVRAEAKKLSFRSTIKAVPKGEQYKPELPLPKKLEPRRARISFVRDVEEIESVAEHLFDDKNVNPSSVGERCFDLISKEARK